MALLIGRAALIAALVGTLAGVALPIAAANMPPATSAAPAVAGASPTPFPTATALAPAAATPAAPAPAPTPTLRPPGPFVARAHRTIATVVPAAQAAFDRGLLMLYAFNIGEARSAFRSVEAADVHETLGYFGEAVAETIDINRPATPDGDERGAAAIARGRAAAAHAPADERELFAAAAQRFDLGRSQFDRLSGFFHALQAYADSHPADGMGLTLAAYAGYNATGVLTNGTDDALTPDARTIVADLDAALRLDPDDAGARHLRIHFWEQAHRPERARVDADALASLAFAPGESHLEHMPGHIYDRLGDYDRMIALNRAACANDRAYFAAGDGDGQRYMRTYHEHDVDFVLYGLTTIGADAQARGFAARESAYSQELAATRLHDNAAVLRLLGDAITPLRAIAEARSGDVPAARADLARLPGGGAETAIATAIVARAAHDDAAAIAAYRTALADAGDDLGDPKTDWWTPIGEGLGATLLEAHAPGDAERVFRAELVRYPNDPHLEFGLAEALAAQGKDDTLPRHAYLDGWRGMKPLRVSDLG